MKFSFESEEYRKNLADKLKEERKIDKSEAKKLLEEEQGSKQYIVSKDIKSVVTNNERTRTSAEDLASSEVLEDKESGLEIQVFDINDKIPQDIKLYLDTIRLREIKSSFSDVKIDGIHTLYSVESSLREHDNWNMVEDNSLNAIREPDWKKRKKEAIEEEALILKARDFINEITNGAFYSAEMLKHIVGGEEEHKHLKSRYPHIKKGGSLLEENIFDISSGGIGGLWFTAGVPGWFSIRKVAIICNPNSERFQNKVLSASPYEGADWEKAREKAAEWSNLQLQEMLKEATKVAERSKVGGVSITFNSRQKWQDVADWVVDLYHGKLYKISEKLAE